MVRSNFARRLATGSGFACRPDSSSPGSGEFWNANAIWKIGLCALLRDGDSASTTNANGVW